MLAEICPVCSSEEIINPDYDQNIENDIEILIEMCVCDDCGSTFEQIWSFVECRNVVDKS